MSISRGSKNLMKAWTCSQGSELGSALRKGQVLMPTPGGSRAGGYLREVLESFRAGTPGSDGSLLPLICSVGSCQEVLLAYSQGLAALHWVVSPVSQLEDS